MSSTAARAPRRMLLGSILVALSGCMTMLVEAQPAGASATGVRTITLEKNCFGCPDASRLVLREDGTAMLTQIGNARRGIAEQTSRGTVARRDFEQLARLAVDQGFFEMKDRYQDESISDGEWATLTIDRGGTDKQVLRREDAGPAGLKAIEAAIEALKARTTFVSVRP